MKNEGKIMVGEGKEVVMNTDVEKKGPNGQSEQDKSPNKQVVRDGSRGVEKPESSKARQEEARKILNDELSRKKILVGTDKEGKPVEKTVLEVIEGGRKAMGELVDTDKWSEKSVESFSDTKKLVEWSQSEEGKKFVDSLVNKDVKDDSEKKEVKGIVDIILNDVWEGDIAEGRKWFESFVDKSKDVKPGDNAGVGDFVKDFELNDREQYVLKNMFPSNKTVPAPGEGSGGGGGVRALPIDEEGGERGRAAPAPDGKDSISETSKDNGPSKKEIDDLMKKIKTKIKEKGKIDWVKYGNFLLFLIIVGAGIQGWYAKMWEQFAERAR